MAKPKGTKKVAGMSKATAMGGCKVTKVKGGSY